MKHTLENHPTSLGFLDFYAKFIHDGIFDRHQLKLLEAILGMEVPAGSPARFFHYQLPLFSKNDDRLGIDIILCDDSADVESNNSDFSGVLIECPNTVLSETMRIEAYREILMVGYRDKCMEQIETLLSEGFSQFWGDEAHCQPIALKKRTLKPHDFDFEVQTEYGNLYIEFRYKPDLSPGVYPDKEGSIVSVHFQTVTCLPVAELTTALRELYGD